MNHEKITGFFHSRFMAIAVGLCAVAAVAVYCMTGNHEPVPGGYGLALPAPDQWIAGQHLSMWVNLAGAVFIAMALCAVNSAFNLMRDSSVLVASLFMLMVMGCPVAAGMLNGGTFLAVVVLVCTFLLFSTYHDRGATRSIYLIFFILGAASFFRYSCLFMIPLFALGCVQMRVFSMRGFVAMLLGIVTAPWILIGFGIVDPALTVWPSFSLIFASFDPDTLPVIAALGFTALLCVLCSLGCMVRTYSYNSKGRAFNGFIYLLSGWTLLLCCVDYSAPAAYFPLLACCAAYQCAHFFVINGRSRSYIAMSAIFLCYAGLYVWNFMA